MTWSQSWDLIKQTQWVRNTLWKMGYNTTPNIITEVGDTIGKFVAAISTGQVSNELQSIVDSLESLVSNVNQGINDLGSGMKACYLTLAPVISYPTKTFSDSFKEYLRRWMHYGQAQTGTNWNFTSGNPNVTCGDTNGDAVNELTVGDYIYLEGDDPMDAGEIQTITNKDTLVLTGNYAGVGGAGTLRLREAVTSRNFTRNAVSAATNNKGDGTIIRYNTDRYGYANESGIATTNVYECVQCPLSGAIENQAKFELSMQGTVAKSSLNNPTAKTLVQTLTAITADDNTIITTNVDFSMAEGAAGAYTKITGWILSDDTKFSRNEETTFGAGDYAYKKKRGTVDATNTVGLGYSIKVLATAGANLIMKTELVTSSLRKDVPYCISVIAKGEAAVTGNVRIEIRDVADTVLATSGNTALSTGFQRLTLSGWFRNFNASPLYICLIRESVGANSMHWSNFIFDKYKEAYNGVWHIGFNGAIDFVSYNQTDKLPDRFTAVDSGGSSGIIQEQTDQTIPGFYLPHATVPTIAEPS
jgi:hypothetical protein